VAESKELLRDSTFALLAVMLWGLAFPLIQEGLDSFGPVTLGFLRFALASAVLMGFVLLRYPFRDIKDTMAREWKPLLVLGLLYVTIPNIAQNIGLDNGTSSIASVIQSSGPVMTLAFAVVLLKERFTTMKGIGTVIAMCGTILLVTVGGITLGNDDFVSNLLILISAATYGLAWVTAKKMIQRNQPMLMIGLSIAIGTLFLGLVAPFEEDRVSNVSADALLNLFVLGVFCAGVSSVFYLRSLEKQEVSRMAFLIYLMPVFASFFAWMLREEGVETWTAVCGVIIVVGIIVANQNHKQG
jgi:drug/metabolite transporter (DMT)-like permease